jgi:hypothetical protein
MSVILSVLPQAAYDGRLTREMILLKDFKEYDVFISYILYVMRVGFGEVSDISCTVVELSCLARVVALVEVTYSCCTFWSTEKCGSGFARDEECPFVAQRVPVNLPHRAGLDCNQSSYEESESCYAQILQGNYIHSPENFSAIGNDVGSRTFTLPPEN